MRRTQRSKHEGDILLLLGRVYLRIQVVLVRREAHGLADRRHNEGQRETNSAERAARDDDGLLCVCAEERMGAVVV